MFGFCWIWVCFLFLKWGSGVILMWIFLLNDDVLYVYFVLLVEFIYMYSFLLVLKMLDVNVLVFNVLVNIKFLLILFLKYLIIFLDWVLLNNILLCLVFVL